MVKFSPLSDRLAGLVPPERAGDALARPGGERHGRKLPAASDSGPAPLDTVSSPAELERAQHDLRTALTRFGREAPGRRAIADRLQPPGRLLDIRV